MKYHTILLAYFIVYLYLCTMLSALQITKNFATFKNEYIDQNKQKVKILIIGSGPSCTCMLTSIYENFKEDSIEYQIDIVDIQKEAGGQWNTNKMSHDNNGNSRKTAMYRNIRTNAPYGAFEIPGHTIKKFLSENPQDDYNENESSFPPPWVIKNYNNALQNEMKEKIRNNKKFIQVNIFYEHQVENINQIENGKKFSVRLNDMKGKKPIKVYEKVIDCSGHFSKPKIIKIKNYETFLEKGNGEKSIIHSVSFLDPGSYSNKVVLIMGDAYSGQDIVCRIKSSMIEIKKTFLDTKIYISRNLNYKKNPEDIDEFPKNWEFVAKLDHINNEGECVLADGSIIKCDTIIQCTGYQYDYPYLDEELAIKDKDANAGKWVKKLYYGVCSMNNPNYFFIGLYRSFQSFPLFLSQAHVVSKIINGEINLNDQKVKEEALNYTKQMEKKMMAVNYKDRDEILESEVYHIESLQFISDIISFSPRYIKTHVLKPFFKIRKECYNFFRGPIIPSVMDKAIEAAKDEIEGKKIVEKEVYEFEMYRDGIMYKVIVPSSKTKKISVIEIKKDKEDIESIPYDIKV